ncbi:light-mediated development protein DET1 isoform X2 [Dendrobium catenatum]|uniref:light-mediated development protein DET1 isoform X2 n=1 Tax=Dendrobium catenatum TaxID=906689 RepID=UPI0009F65967|nr:light-mediated development protein DET1 isoform X2 [Dendrobium catenatum]
MFKSLNVTARVFERQIVQPRPSASVNSVRQFYENFVPSCTIYDIDCPDNSFRKITDDGKYLISFSRNHQELIVYRPTWLSFSYKGEDCDSDALSQRAKRFDSFFIHLYTVSLATSNEFICKEFFLYLEGLEFGIFATSTALSHEAPATEGAVNGVQCIERIVFHLVRLEDGFVLDEKVFCNDFVNLNHSMGVFLHEDLLCIMSLRYQAIHIVQITDSGNLVDVRIVGTFCHEDDELFIGSHIQVTEGQIFLSGIKQRLLSYIFRKHWSEETDQTLRIQHLKKKFYFHFQDYIDLIMWKVQFLDRHHLLIKFGSVDGVVSRTTEQHPSFFAVYNIEKAEIISFFQNSTEELYYLYEQFCDHFTASSRSSLHANFISSHSNNIYAFDQLCVIKNRASNFLQFVKKMVSSLPYTCQSQSPSPYFDLSLFRYSTEHPIKFISRRQPHILKFKIKPGSEASGSDARPKRISSFLFHPYLPLAISIQQTFMQPTVVNIHFRR